MVRFSFYRVLVVGDDHKSMVDNFSLEKVYPKHIVYRYDDAEMLKEKKIDELKSLISSIGKDSPLYDERVAEIAYYENMDAFDYYLELTRGLEYDEETGDALSERNPDTKFKNARYCQDELLSKGRECVFADPFILKNGGISYSSKINDIDWDMMHMHNATTYSDAWELCMEGRIPENEGERFLYENMKDHIPYFNEFGSRDNYVKLSSCFWTHAIINGGKYIDIRSARDVVEWASGFYETYVVPIIKSGRDELLSIYEAKPTTV